MFFFALWILLSFPHPLVIGLTHSIYGQSLDPMGIHVVHCAHGEKRTTSSGVIQDALHPLQKMQSLMFFQKQTHVLSPPFFQSSSRRINIVLSIDGIHTLVNVAIADPTHVDFGIMGNFFSWGNCDTSD